MPRLLPAAVLVSAAAILLTPGVASASDSDQWAWLTARKPSATDYTPATKDRGNVANMANTIHRSAPGFYTVTFHGVGSNPNRVGEMIVTAIERSAALLHSERPGRRRPRGRPRADQLLFVGRRGC